jgi:hypothetical protein
MDISCGGLMITSRTGKSKYSGIAPHLTRQKKRPGERGDVL